MDGFIRVPAYADAVTAREYRVFLACYLATGIAALAGLPFYTAFTGALSVAGMLVVLVLAFPLAVSVYAMRTGALERSHMIAVLTASVLLCALTAATGGLFSPALPALAIVLGLGFACGSARTRTAVVAVTVGALIAVVAGHRAGFVSAASIEAALPLPAWLAGMVIAFPSLLHAAVWMHTTRLAVRENAERARSEVRHYTRMVDNAADMVTLHNRVGNLLHASEAASRLLGVAPAALRDAGLFNRVHVADRPAYLRMIDAAQAGQETDPADVRVRVGEIGECAPTYAWFEMRCRAIPASQDVVAVLRETGRRKAHEEQLDTAIAEAQRANAMKTRFLASVSHELRTPLNAIIGFSEVLEQELFGAFEYDKHREYAGLIHQSGRHLLDVVNDILDMSKIEAGKFEIFTEPFDIEPVLKDCAAMLQGKAESRQVNVELAIEPHLPEVAADRRALRQICLNLVSNAIKFTREDTAEGESRIVIGATRQGDNVRIVVKDNGIGIAAEDLAHVGEPFFQAHASYARRYEGTGLGLSVVKGLVHLHGGRLDIDSTLGLGTTVTIMLPIKGPDGQNMQDMQDGSSDAGLVEPLRRRETLPPPPGELIASDLALVAPLTRKAG